MNIYLVPSDSHNTVNSRVCSTVHRSAANVALKETLRTIPEARSATHAPKVARDHYCGGDIRVSTSHRDIRSL